MPGLFPAFKAEAGREKMKIRRHEANPIVRPGMFDWRRVAVFNPGVIYENERVYLYERAAGSLCPFQTVIGMLVSDDGVRFTHAADRPVFTGAMAGYPEGSVQDARIVKIDGLYYMSYAIQPYQMNCHPNGIGVPDYITGHYRGWDNCAAPMITQSGIAVSEDLYNFKHVCFNTPREIDDRDNMLFPCKIKGRFATLRRPMSHVGEKYGTSGPSIWISYSDDLMEWTEPVLVASPEQEWEGGKIGAAAPPILCDEGWLLLYHGVDKRSVYRVGAMLLDPENPEKVVARTRDYIMEPEEYYEKFGLVIPNVVFPTGNILIDGLLYIYYGCADTCISLATVPFKELLDHVLKQPVYH